MSDPSKYERSYSFTDFQTGNPSAPLPGIQVDNELENVEQSLGEAIDAIKDVRRSDGKLKNGIVTVDSLDPTVAAGVGAGALASAEAAADSADQAMTARDFAAQWASAPEGQDVNDGVNPVDKSAYHWAQVALGVAAGALPDGSVTAEKLAATALPIFPTVAGMAGLDVPLTVKTIRVNGAAVAGDGMGGLFVDSDNGRGVAFTSGGVTARNWYVADDSTGSKVWGSGFYRKDRARFADAPHLFEFINPTAHNAIETNSSSYDATGEIIQALSAFSGMKVHAPKGTIKVRGTIVVPAGTSLAGHGKADSWEQVGPTGTIFDIIDSADAWTGAGKWTDRNDADTLLKPLFVAGGNEVSLSDFTVNSPVSANRGDVGVLLSGVKQCNLDNISALGPWAQYGLMLDTSVTLFNTDVAALHPDVIYSQGCNENNIWGCYWEGVKGVGLIGNLRTNLGSLPVPTAEKYRGGLSDNNFWGGGARPHGLTDAELAASGAAVEADAVIWIAGTGQSVAQDIRFNGFYPRVGTYSKWAIKLGGINRVTFALAYAEASVGRPLPARIEGSSATGRISFLNFYARGMEIWKDGAVVAAGDDAFNTPANYAAAFPVWSVKTGYGEEAFRNLYLSSGGTAGLTLDRVNSGEVIKFKFNGSDTGAIEQTSTTFRYPLGSGAVITSNATSPEGSVVAPVGSLCTNRANGNLYLKKTGTGNTGWVLVP